MEDRFSLATPTDSIRICSIIPRARHWLITRFFFLHSIVVSALQLLLPLANAYSAAYLLSVSSCALAAYIYLRWLFTDKWVALFGAVVFGFSPFAVAVPQLPEIIWIAPLPLVMYFAHRGFRERRAGLIMLAGILGGLTCDVTLYFLCRRAHVSRPSAYGIRRAAMERQRLLGARRAVDRAFRFVQWLADPPDASEFSGSGFCS